MRRSVLLCWDLAKLLIYRRRETNNGQKCSFVDGKLLPGAQPRFPRAEQSRVPGRDYRAFP